MRPSASEERRIRKEEAKSKKVGGTETAELSRNRMERGGFRASERATRLKGRVVPRRKKEGAPTRDGWRKVGKRIRKCRKKIEKPKENTRDNEEW